MESRDIIKVVLTQRASIKKTFADFIGLIRTHLAINQAHDTIIGCCQYLSLHLYECIIPGNSFFNYLVLYEKRRIYRKIIIMIMVIIQRSPSFALMINKQFRKDICRVWYISSLKFRWFKNPNQYFTNCKSISTVSQLQQNKQE